jgi:hypothetical protein
MTGTGLLVGSDWSDVGIGSAAEVVAGTVATTIVGLIRATCKLLLLSQKKLKTPKTTRLSSSR